MNKICTTIEQSKKLIELGIDVNTADMDYVPYVNDMTEYDCVVNIWNNEHEENWIPCWSLSALLELIPNWQIQTQDNSIGILYGCKEEVKIIEGKTPLDAAFEMVVWLKENKKI